MKKKRTDKSDKRTKSKMLFGSLKKENDALKTELRHLHRKFRNIRRELEVVSGDLELISGNLTDAIESVLD